MALQRRSSLVDLLKVILGDARSRVMSMLVVGTIYDQIDDDGQRLEEDEMNVASGAAQNGLRRQQCPAQAVHKRCGIVYREPE